MKTIYQNGEHRVCITREQYHKNKKKFKTKVEIVAIPQKFNMNYVGYQYYALASILEKLV